MGLRRVVLVVESSPSNNKESLFEYVLWVRKTKYRLAYSYITKEEAHLVVFLEISLCSVCVCMHACVKIYTLMLHRKMLQTAVDPL